MKYKLDKELAYNLLLKNQQYHMLF